MAKIFLTLILGSILFVNCSNPTEKADNMKNNSISKDSNSKPSITSEITCPKCGFKKTENLPTDVCVIKYTCKNCNTELTPKVGDCCVFCTYGTHKCPSKQED